MITRFGEIMTHLENVITISVRSLYYIIGKVITLFGFIIFVLTFQEIITLLGVTRP